jgi:hypothetical protein
MTPDAKIEGSLERESLTEVLKKIASRQWEGLLTLSWKERSIFVLCKEAEVVRAWEGEEEALLGALLVRAKKMTQEQLENGFRIQKNINQPLLRTIVEMGYVSPQEIKRLVWVLSEEVLYPIFSWPAGRFTFEQKTVAFDPDLLLPLAIEEVIKAGKRQSAAWPGLLKKIPSLHLIFEIPPENKLEGESTATDIDYEATQVILDRTVQHLRVDDGEISHERISWEWLLLLVDGQRTIEEIIHQAEIKAFSAFLVYTGLCSLLEVGRIRPQNEIPQSVRHPVEPPEPTEPAPHVTARKEKEEKPGETKKKSTPAARPTPAAAVSTPPPPPPGLREISHPSMNGAAAPLGDLLKMPAGERAEETAVKETKASVFKAKIEAAFEGKRADHLGINVLAIAASVAIFAFSLPVVPSIVGVRGSLEQALSPIVKWNEEDRIRLALDLYHLEHERFPSSVSHLNRLLPAEQKIHPDEWRYLGGTDRYELVRRSAPP